MTTTLDQLLKNHPPIQDMDIVWAQAMEKADRHPLNRSERGVSPKEKMQRLKLWWTAKSSVSTISCRSRFTGGDILNTQPGTHLWDVAIPLTLFPKRQSGFSHVECVMEFSVPEGHFFRVLKLFPEERTELLARSELGGKLEFKANAKLGLAMPPLLGESAVEVAGKLYAKTETAGVSYEIRRACVETAIIKGTHARWRLDDVHDRERFGAESHQLRVILETGEITPSLNAAGYLQAYSDERWLSKTVGTFWKDFTGSLKTFFKRGLPREAYGEWDNILAAVQTERAA